MIGNPNEDINDLMETLEFWLEFNIEVDPFICTPYVGSPIFYNNKDRILEQYDERLKLAKNNPKIDQKTIKKWKLAALDKFMTECGDATAYTATVSKYFTISELYAIKRFMYTKDPERLLRMAHERFEQTGQKQWMHDEKWKKYCAICKANDEIFPSIEITKN